MFKSLSGKKKQEELEPVPMQEIWTPPAPEIQKYQWFARHVLLANVENQLNQLEDEGYFDIEVRYFLPGDKVANTSIFITARKVKDTKNEK